MKAPQVAVSRVVDAPPDVVFAVFSDYEKAHAEILPKPYFDSMMVEQGGRGAGTVVNVTMRVLGVERKLRLAVTEPEPGRVLAEEDPEAGVRTTFTVVPVDNGARSQVEIASVWQPKSGLAGWVDGLLNPLFARRIYHQELDLLAEYVVRNKPR